MGLLGHYRVGAHWSTAAKRMRLGSDARQGDVKEKKVFVEASKGVSEVKSKLSQPAEQTQAPETGASFELRCGSGAQCQLARR